MRKFWLKIKLTFFYLFQGLISADKLIRNNKEDEINVNSNIEQQVEQQSVFKDLLKGELTEEVKELRHEMYYSERKSCEYVYNGGGNAKKNKFFDYKGSVENSDGNPVTIVLINKQIINGLCDDGVAVMGNQAAVSTELQGEFKMPISNGKERYSFEIERNFIPRFKIEKYTTKLVVKNVVEKKGKSLLDFYIPEYRQQFNNITKFLQSELDKIYQGNYKSDLTDFNKISFITKNCFGVPDLFLFEYNNIVFSDIIKFDGHYVLRFYCDILTNGEDTLTDIYHEETARKCEKNEMRKNATIDVSSLLSKQENVDTSESEKLINELKNKKEEKN